MQGWKLFIHAVRMVVGNWRDAIRIFWAPCVLMGLLFLGLIRAMSNIFGENFSETGTIAGTPSGGSIGLSFLLMLLMFFVIGWGIVAWHRFVLAEEQQSGLIPQFHLGRILAYFGRLFLLGLACAICAIPLMMIGTSVMGSGSIAGTLAVLFVISVLTSVLMYRWVAILPAAALGKPLTFGEAWSATSGATGAILVLMLTVWAVSYGGQYLVQAIYGISPFVGTAVDIVFTALVGLVNISILTTFYGHYVEGRSID
ncbi:hypothetical protein [Shimia sagamensis]|uniref:Uncharacterized protein n=1 Tax=Shimia sagamensis TaxID=1566352 RepID=A0ABY1NB22_9RHOB|nr:hypothetical protein [Shimia sagamensis]SMP05281.1 hypothetical protein SAMN06265373_101546 [Shimia sagamensis]